MATFINPSNAGNLDSISSEVETNESEQYFMDYLKNQVVKMTYEIKSSETSGDSATVTVSCKYIDGTPLLKATVAEFLTQAIGLAFSGTELTDEQTNDMMKEIMAEKQKTVEDTYVESTVQLKCIKVNDKWLIDNVGEDMGNVIMSNFIAAVDEISSFFGNCGTDEAAIPPQAPQIGTGTVGDYSVSIIGYEIAQDYEKNPAVIITYEWTNNSDKATSFMSSLIAQAFQNGIECETAIISGNDNYDSEASMKDIKPGITLTVQEAYLLQDTENPIEIEVSEFLSFESNPPIVTQTFEIK